MSLHERIKTKERFLITALLLFAIPITTYLLQQRQDIRQFALTTSSTTPGALSLTATYQSISVYAPFTEDNGNNSATFRWRRTEEIEGWKPGMDMTVDRRLSLNGRDNPYASQYRASIFKVQPNTSYEVEVTFSDPDGVNGTNPVRGTVTTRDDNYPVGVSGVTYYVATTGSDSNPGTESQPFRTIGKAASVVNPGDTVLVRGGAYAGSTTISRSGSSSSYIDIKAYPDERPLLSGGNPVVSITGKFIRFSGFAITGSTPGIRVSSPATDVVIEKNYISDGTISSAPIGIHITSGVSNVTIQDNEIHPPKTDGSDGGAIYFISTVGGHVIRRNQIVFDHVGTSGVHGRDCIVGSPNFDINGGYNKDTDIYDNECIGATDDGISLDGGTVNVRVWGNKITGANLGISIAPIYIGPVYIFRNVLYDLKAHWVSSKCTGVKNGEGGTGFVYFYHNTFYLPNTSVCGGKTNGFGTEATPASQNVVIKNNIIQVSHRPIIFQSGGKPETNYNLLSNATSGIFTIWNGTDYNSFSTYVSGTGQEKQGINGKAAFVNVAEGDFKLASNSLGVDKGVVLNGFNDANSPWPYVGGAPDIGAFESGFVSPSPTGGSTPTLPPSSAKVRVELSLPAIGNTSVDNNSPLHPNRTIVVELLNGVSQLIKSSSGNVVYSAPSGAFTGTIDLGNITSGTYYIKLKLENTLRKLVPGFFSFSAGSTVNLPKVELITGDINNDNTMNILDYTILLSCFASKPCSFKIPSDFNDDGAIDPIDYNIFIRSLTQRSGD